MLLFLRNAEHASLFNIVYKYMYTFNNKIIYKKSMSETLGNKSTAWIATIIWTYNKAHKCRHVLGILAVCNVFHKEDTEKHIDSVHR